jgi:type II secretory ATPase GspE/PulE/Tfp pilus assembly ATPase PilB-like protein
MTRPAGDQRDRNDANASSTDETTDSPGGATSVATWSKPDTPGWLVLLERTGLVSPDVLQAALRDTDHDEQRAGEWLVAHGCVAERDLVLAQAESHGLAFVEPGDFRVNLENRSIVAEELARAQSVFPLFITDRIITLAVAWPLELNVLDQIRLHTGCEVDQCLSTPRELRQLIEWAYGGFHGQSETKSPDAFAWEDILKDVADAPAVKLVNVLLDQAAAARASDIHIDPEEQNLRVRFRIDGVLREVPAPPKTLLPGIVSRIKVMAHMDIAESRRPQDGHFKLAVGRDELDIRVSTLPSADGEAVVLRLLYGRGHFLSLDELGMDAGTQQTFDRLIHLPHGMLLVTGPTGSGKTTTLYSALARIDRVRQSIVTLEEPVEIRLPQIRQVSVNPKAGLTFLTGLRAILRQDPDVIMIGEIRDRETAETALQAALTGHLMLATLHTNSAAAAPARLLDMGVQDFLVSSALVGVLAQRLCRRLCQHCAREVSDVAAIGALLPPTAAETLDGGKLLEPVGCKRCGNTGYEGRVGVYELLVVNDEIRQAVLTRQDERTLIGLARDNGMRLLVEDGLTKICRGLTTVPELLRVAGRVDTVEHWAPPPAPAGGGAGETNAAREPGTGQREPVFDVPAYERLLNRWLRPRGHPSQPVGASCGDPASES